MVKGLLTIVMTSNKYQLFFIIIAADFLAKIKYFIFHQQKIVITIEYYNICPQRSVVTYGCCNLWNVVAFGYNKFYQKMACSPGFVKYHVNMSRPNAVTDHVSITCIASRNEPRCRCHHKQPNTYQITNKGSSKYIDSETLFLSSLIIAAATRNQLALQNKVYYYQQKFTNSLSVNCQIQLLREQWQLHLQLHLQPQQKQQQQQQQKQQQQLQQQHAGAAVAAATAAAATAAVSATG